MQEKKRNDIGNLIVLLFSVLPVIDSLNGMLITEGIWTHLGTIYKIAILFILFVIVLIYEKFSIRYLLLLICSLVYVGFTTFFNVMFREAKVSYDHSIKFIFNIMIMSLLLQLLKLRIINGKSFFTIFDNSLTLMVICILVPYLSGAGYTIYAGNIGYKGFFYSQNELNAILIILFGFSLYKNICKITLYSVAQLLAISVCVMLMSSKSSMLACCMGLAVFFFEYLRRKGNRHKILVVFSSLLIAVFGIGFIMAKIQDVFDRQSSLYKLYGNDVFATITSGRILFLVDAFKDFVSEKYLLIRLFIGNGFETKNLVEMDFFDIFFYLGMIGLSFLIIGVTIIFLKSKKNIIQDETIIRGFNYLLIIGFSFLTGHVMFMATSGCYFVLLCCFNMSYSCKKNKKERCSYEG